MWWILILPSCGSNLDEDGLPPRPQLGTDGTDLQLDTAGLLEADTAAPETAEIQIISADPCENPCTFTAEASEDIVAARYEADSWLLGTSFEEDLSLTYDFLSPGVREITVYGRDDRGVIVAEHTRWITIEEPASDSKSYCPNYHSDSAESAPVQTTGAGVPDGASALLWQTPTSSTYTTSFSGTVGKPASHEGLDYVHNDPSVGSVPVQAAADGRIVYVRTGCSQSDTFSANQSVRECGAGWGNHVVTHHGGTFYTRYAHLEEGTVKVEVGHTIRAGQELAAMGNSGRSDVRHLHFELGAKADGFDSCADSQSFDTVHNPALVGL